METLKLKVRRNAPGIGLFTEEQLQVLADSFVVCLAPGDVIVHFGQEPPFESYKRWQETDSYGAPVGRIKTYQGGLWK